MKKTMAKQVMIYVMIMGVILLLAVYFLIFKSYTDKAQLIQESNVVLSQRVNVLKQYYEKMDSYNNEIVLMQDQIRDWLDEFPADVKEEDIIVLALDTEKNAYVDYSTINIMDREALRTIPAATMQGVGMEELTQDLIFVQRKTSYVNKTDYYNMKKCVASINDSDNRLTISNITYVKNKETGELEGTIEVTFYSAIGTGKEYIPQKLPAYVSGLHDLFGITEIPGESEEIEE